MPAPFHFSPVRPCLILLLLLTAFAFSQEQRRILWAPVPFDAHEPVTSVPRTLTDPQERAAALQLLDRARQNYTFYGPHTPAFDLHVSFVSNGQLQYEGQGSMEEIWTGKGSERWSAKLGSTEVLRILYAGRMWSDDPSAVIPMRVQMVRSAILWPVVNTPARVMLRAAAAVIDGKPAMCMLTSGSVGNLDQQRHWVEKEYCVDPETGNLLSWSEAPGHYVYYDYSASTQFQGHLVANDISIYEAGSRILQIHVDKLVDASGVTPELLRPPAPMMAKGPSFGLRGPMKFPMRVFTAPGTAATLIQPVFVHATLDREGHVIEAEALQNSNPELATRAIDAFKSRTQGKSMGQREVFVDVEFFYPATDAAPTGG